MILLLFFLRFLHFLAIYTSISIPSFNRLLFAINSFAPSLTLFFFYILLLSLSLLHCSISATYLSLISYLSYSILSLVLLFVGTVSVFAVCPCLLVVLLLLGWLSAIAKYTRWFLDMFCQLALFPHISLIDIFVIISGFALVLFLLLIISACFICFVVFC